MASATLKAQLAQLIRSMLDEKLLNDNYCDVEMLRTSKNPTFIVDMLTASCEESTKNLCQLDYLLNGDEEGINYEEITKFATKLRSCVNSIGAERMVRAIEVLRYYCFVNIKEGCLKAFAEIRQEYILLESKLLMIIQLEKQILMAEAEEKK